MAEGGSVHHRVVIAIEATALAVPYIPVFKTLVVHQLIQQLKLSSFEVGTLASGAATQQHCNTCVHCLSSAQNLSGGAGDICNTRWDCEMRLDKHALDMRCSSSRSMDERHTGASGRYWQCSSTGGVGRGALYAGAAQRVDTC